MEDHVYTNTPELGESLLALGEHLTATFGDWNKPNPALSVLIDTIGWEQARKIWWAGQRVLQAQKRVRQAIDEGDINPLLNSTDVETVEEYERRKS